MVSSSNRKSKLESRVLHRERGIPRRAHHVRVCPWLKTHANNSSTKKNTSASCNRIKANKLTGDMSIRERPAENNTQPPPSKTLGAQQMGPTTSRITREKSRDHLEQNPARAAAWRQQAQALTSLTTLIREPEEMRLLSGAGDAALLMDIPWRLDSRSLESFRSILLHRGVARRGMARKGPPGQKDRRPRGSGKQNSQTVPQTVVKPYHNSSGNE